jgi:TusA-related sulfurtransferase
MTVPTVIPDQTLDLFGVPCPANTARALLKLEIMDSGEILAILLDSGEPITNVPSSLEVEGHTVVECAPAGAGWRLLVRRE